MDAWEIPNMVFDEVLFSSGATPYAIEVGPNQVCTLVFLPPTQAAMGYQEEERYQKIMAHLKVWHHFFNPTFQPEDFKKELEREPSLEVMGGPFFDGTYDQLQRQGFVEKVTMDSALKISDVLVSEKFIYLVNRIQDVTRRLVKEKKPKRSKYWIKV